MRLAAQPLDHNAPMAQAERTTNAADGQLKLGVGVQARLLELGQIGVRLAEGLQRPEGEVVRFAVPSEHVELENGTDECKVSPCLDYFTI